jgi:hypothetical protein
MKIGFDVISDLNLSQDESFNWENKATSLYLIISGNISSDLRVIYQTLLHLSKLYQGIFYIPGPVEFSNSLNVRTKLDEIERICKTIKNVAFLENNVIIVDSIAVVGVTGWYCSSKNPDTSSIASIIAMAINQEDAAYLCMTVEKLQLHLDVKKVVVVTATVPCEELYFGQNPDIIDDYISLTVCLDGDTEHKISHWVYGTYDKNVDVQLGKITYINNSYYKRRPYWAKRFEIDVN